MLIAESASRMAAAASLMACVRRAFASPEAAGGVPPDWLPSSLAGGGVAEVPSSATSWRSDSSRVGAKPTLSPKAVRTERSTGYDAEPVPCT